MTRPKLHAVRSYRRPSFSQLRKAIRLFRAPGIPREVYRRNALAWLRSVQWLGERHILKGGERKWGVPGEPIVGSLATPRRLRERA